MPTLPAIAIREAQSHTNKKKLWDGDEISLWARAPFPEIWMHGSGLQLCGESRVSDEPYGVVFDEHLTGDDIDRDGRPEVVFMTDQAGGAHGCWVYNVVSLFPKPHRLFAVGENPGIQFQKDPEGKMIDRSDP